MRGCFSSIVGLVFVAACGPPEAAFVGELESSVVYGEDDRVEVYAHPDAELRRIAGESIVALIPASRIAETAQGGYRIVAASLEDQRDVCADERFADQTVAASCSGVLIADDLVLTAGHCINPSRPCTVFNYVFDYYLDGPDQPASIDDEDVYTCRRVVLDADAGRGELTPDFAIIQLDRPVSGSHLPADVRPATALEEGAPLAMIGSGSGLPVKIDAGAWIADARPEQLDYLVVNLDAFEGHSGSASFDENAQLAGILIGGRVPDYVSSPGEDCLRVNRFEDAQAGEIVHNIAPIVDALCESGEGPDYLCEPDACDGNPCGAPSSPTKGEGTGAPGVAAGGASGCRVSPSAPAGHFVWLAWLFAWALRRVRRSTV